MLIAGRALQGLGGALLSPAALAVITTTFAEGSERTKALAVWAAIASGGSAVGLLLGGILVDALSWEWIFAVNVPIGIAIAIAALRLVPNSRIESATRHFDIPGAVSVTAGLSLLVYTIVKAQEWGWGSVETLGLGAVALALLGAVRRDRVALAGAAGPARAVPAALAGARQRGLPAPDGGDVLDVLLRLDLRPERARLLGADRRARVPAGDRRDHDRRHRGPAAGAADRRPRRDPDRHAGGERSGSRCSPLGTQVDGTYLGLLAGLLPVSIGLGLSFVPLTLVATTGVAENEAGLASGVFNTSQQIGGALGLAVLATLANDRTVSFLSGLGGAPTPAQQSAALVDGLPARLLRRRRPVRRRHDRWSRRCCGAATWR